MSHSRELYDDLMLLVDSTDTFYYIDQIINDVTYRIFSYRVALFEDFMLPNGLECRGHTFRLNSAGDFDDIVSYPFEKFFNLNENPYTQDLDLSDIRFIHEKRDGSLISTFMHDGKVALKSKTSLSSDQALDANKVLYADKKLLDIVTSFVKDSCTVNMEFTAPHNRIVLPYETSELKVLSVRHHSGQYLDYTDLYKDFDGYMVEDYTKKYSHDVHGFIMDVPGMTGIEGFVIGLGNGQRIKIKTAEYLKLHRARDLISSDKNLFKYILTEEIDDLKALFYDNPFEYGRIEQMEHFIHDTLSSLVSSVEDYHDTNKGLTRKDYAIKGQDTLSPIEFSLVMQRYSGKEPTYREMMLKRVDQLLET